MASTEKTCKQKIVLGDFYMVVSVGCSHADDMGTVMKIMTWQKVA